MTTVEDDSCLCPVCKEHFTDGAVKAPACLGCGHILCRQCAVIITNDADPARRTCPICRARCSSSDVRIVYVVGGVRVQTERDSTLECENERLRQRLRTSERQNETQLKTLEWYEKERSERCHQRSKMLAHYRDTNRSLYAKMRYYRDNWYRLKHYLEKVKTQKARIHTELSSLKRRYKCLNSPIGRVGGGGGGGVRRRTVRARRRSSLLNGSWSMRS